MGRQYECTFVGRLVSVDANPDSSGVYHAHFELLPARTSGTLQEVHNVPIGREQHAQYQRMLEEVKENKAMRNQPFIFAKLTIETQIDEKLCF